MNVGVVLILSKGFELASPERISPEMKEKMGYLYFQWYRSNKKNIIVIGPAPGQKYSEIVFPILPLHPATKNDIHFLKYLIYVGGNRGRGQIYPDGIKSNNTVYNVTSVGIVSKIVHKKGGIRNIQSAAKIWGGRKSVWQKPKLYGPHLIFKVLIGSGP
ncbi:Apocytochrome f [Platanthera guangdongensis]|uniref:Apocytochrome f n=1 Tax=Platanthera guangdongensis TaxID=2320717 RepID=A0ABR2LFQ6_9ASPA